MAKSALLFFFLMFACLMVLSVNAKPVEDEDPCICITTDDLNYVCGSDGITYPNISTLRCENQCKRLNIEMKHEGEC